MDFHSSNDQFDYAFQTSRIIQKPARFIDTFGLTRFDFLMASELMDSVGRVRIRAGVIEAQKPQIIKPLSYSEIEIKGFSEEAKGKAQQMLERLKSRGEDLAFMRYGFEFKKIETKDEIVQESLEIVIENLKKEADRRSNPALAILEGVDDTWEVGLFKFTIEMIQRSAQINVRDYKRNGLL